MPSNYILQSSHKSHCPKCDRVVDLLCTGGDMLTAIKKKPWFYICWHCHQVFELGKGRVEREGE